jgi:peptidyl-prolyl cis-trans isomerase A (cyclophilin A)
LGRHGGARQFSTGRVFIELSDDTTPITANSFLSYVNDGLYNGTVIHRLVLGFVFQGGWLKYNQAISTFAPIASKGNIQNEFRVSNQRGTIAMAWVKENINQFGGDPNNVMIYGQSGGGGAWYL